MIDLSPAYRRMVKTNWGKEGEEWLAQIPELLSKYSNIFDLRDLRLCGNLSYNLVLSGECLKYGSVIVKIGLPDNGVLNEMIALEAYNGKLACKCHFSDKKDRVMILERLIPGETLHKIKDRLKRVEIFAQTANDLMIEDPENQRLPLYGEVLARAFQKADNDSDKYKELIGQIRQAEKFYREITEAKLPKYLLHGDLHHGNILSCKEGWKAIDPHGFIGERIVEAARFMENEIAIEELSESNIREVIDLTSKYYREDKDKLARVLFIDHILTGCWNIEENCSEEERRRDMAMADCIIAIIANNRY